MPPRTVGADPADLERSMQPLHDRHSHSHGQSSSSISLRHHSHIRAQGGQRLESPIANSQTIPDDPTDRLYRASSFTKPSPFLDAAQLPASKHSPRGLAPRSIGTDTDRERSGARGNMSGERRMPSIGIGRPGGYGGPLEPARYGPPEVPQLADAIPPHLVGIGPWSDRPSSSRAGLSTASGERGDSRGGRFSPTLPGLSPRAFGSHAPHRLPSLTDFTRSDRDRWDAPQSTGYTTRPPTSYADDHRRFPSNPGPFAHHPPPQPGYTGPLQSDFYSERRRPREEDYAEPSETAGQSPMTTGAEGDKADDDRTDNATGGNGKKKKRRVALSCAECAKRKQRCNREQPCQHCVSRRVPELCVPYTRTGSPSKKDKGSSSREEAVKTERPGTASGGDPGLSIKEPTQVQQAPVMAPRASGMLPTLSVRVTRIEAMLNAVINRVDGVDGKALNDWRINHPPASSPPTLDAALPKEQLNSPGSVRSRPDTAVRANSTEGDAEPGDVRGLDDDTVTRNPLPQSLIRTSDPMHLRLDYHGTPAEGLSSLLSELGMDTGKVAALLADLPGEDMMNKLVDHFFTRFNFVRYPISEYLFRQNLSALYKDKTVNPTAVLAMPLVFVVFAISSRCAPDGWFENGDEQRRYSLKMYWNSRSAVIVSSAIKTENLSLVETRICTGLYLILMHERRLAEGWSELRAAITTGQAIGLHRDGTKLGLDKYMTEYRRRLWSYLIHADACYSCILGRPMSIDLSCCDTLPPSNINLHELAPDDGVSVTGDTRNPFSTPTATEGDALPSAASDRSKPSNQRSRQKDPHVRPLETPTFATYLILRRRLGEIVAMITHNFQQLRGQGAQGSYKEIERIGDEMKRFVGGLPRCFRMEDPDKSLDKELWYLPTHRYYIQTEILHFTIILHRPWFLRKLNSNRYLPSRLACFEAAVLDHKIRKAFAIEVPDFLETLLYSSFRAFNSAMIAGLSLIVDPQNEHASDMRDIVQSFMQQHPHDPAADEFSQKEAAIISTLHKRAQEAAKKQSRTSYRFDIRGNVSNERGTPMSSSGRASRDEEEELAEPTSPESKPLPPSEVSRVHPHIDDRTANKSPVKQLLQKERISLGSSPDENDHSQRLLDQWLMSTTSFGPGSDGTMNPFVTTAMPTAQTFQPFTYTQPAQGQYESPSFPGSATMPSSAQLANVWPTHQTQTGSLQAAALGLGPGPGPASAPPLSFAADMSAKPPNRPSNQNAMLPYGFPGAAGGMMGGAEPLVGLPVQHGLNNAQGLQGMGAGMAVVTNGANGGMYNQGMQGQQSDVSWNQAGMTGEGVGAYWNTLIDGIMGQGM